MQRRSTYKISNKREQLTSLSTSVIILIALLVGLVTSQDSGVTSVTLETICSSSSQCSEKIANSECRDDGTNTNTKRCLCLNGYTSYLSKSDSSFYCGKAVTSLANAACKTCENNEGMCYLQSANDTELDYGVHCKCPSYRSGNICQIKPVSVICSGSDLTMKVCYDASSIRDFSNVSLSMAANGHFDVPTCVGAIIQPTNSWCPSGSYGLQLSLNSSNLDRCGTRTTESVTQKTYYSTIQFQETNNDSTTTLLSSMSFRAYCTFSMFDNKMFQALGAQENNGNEQGQVVLPDVSLRILNQYDQVIPTGVMLRVGDLIRFVFSLNRTSSSYNSLSVQYCTASSSAIMPDSNAQTMPLVINGCPASTSLKSWGFTQRNQGDQTVYSIQTNQLPAFRLTSSTTVYVHCTLKLCLLDDSTCTAALQSDKCSSSARKKRSLESMEWMSEFDDDLHSVARRKRAVDTGSAQTVSIASRLDVYDPNSADSTSSSSLSSPGTITAFIVALVVVVIVLIVVGAAIAYRLNRHPSEPEMIMPQQFAMRRIPQPAVGYSRF